MVMRVEAETDTPGSLFDQVCDFGNLLAAYRKAARGKRFQENVADFDYYLEWEFLRLRDQLPAMLSRRSSSAAFFPIRMPIVWGKASIRPSIAARTSPGVIVMFSVVISSSSSPPSISPSCIAFWPAPSLIRRCSGSVE